MTKTQEGYRAPNIIILENLDLEVPKICLRRATYLRVASQEALPNVTEPRIDILLLIWWITQEVYLGQIGFRHQGEANDPEVKSLSTNLADQLRLGQSRMILPTWHEVGPIIDYDFIKCRNTNKNEQFYSLPLDELLDFAFSAVQCLLFVFRNVFQNFRWHTSYDNIVSKGFGDYCTSTDHDAISNGDARTDC